LAIAVLLLVPVGAATPGIAAAAQPVRTTAAAASPCPWVDSHASPTQRADAVLDRMTLSEKLGMLGLANSSDGYENVTTAVPSLCVPRLILQDGPAGITAGPAGSHTQLPAPIGVGASFSTAVAREYGEVQGGEAAAKGVDAVQGPDVNMARVPQGGRDDEGYGEDPYLSGQLGVADADGIESQGEMVMVKHFDAYNQETNRNTTSDDDIVSTRVLHEIYLPAFQDVVQDAHVAAVMCSYAEINGVFSCQNPMLLTDVLRDQWGFQGFIRSDLGAVHDPVAAFNAGIDQVKPAVTSQIEAAVSDGQVSMATINAAVRSVLTTMFRYGVFNKTPTGTADTDASTPAHQADAESIAEQGSVLLQNTGQILPLDKASVGSIAVIGADGGSGADTAMTSKSSAYVSAASVVTPYQGIQAAAGPGVPVTYNDGSDLTSAAAAAAAAKVAMVFVDDPAGEGADLSSLSLPGDQDQLIDAVAAANPDTIVVINSGNPVLMPWLSQVKGVIEAWYPGQEDGDAIAALLFGTVDPSGKLPMTFPQSASQTPTSSPQQWPGENGQVDYSEGLDMGYRGYDAEDITPLFPFGYGLSYTTFRFSDLSVSPGSTTSPGDVRVAATVTNTGDRTGSEVAQLYVGDPVSTGEPPRQLKGFQKVTLAPGQSTQVRFTLTGQDLSWYDSAVNTWVVTPGSYQVYVGDSSALANLPLSGSFQVTGSTGTRHVMLSAPGSARAGAPFTVTATLTSGGDLTVHGARLTLSVPVGWQVQPSTPTTAGSLSASQSQTVSWRVTAPAAAQDDIDQLGVTASYHTGGGTGSSTAYTQVTVDPLVTTTVTPQTIVATPGTSTPVTVTDTDTSGYPIRLNWSAVPPSGSGITITSASGSASLSPGASASTELSVTASSAAAFGTDTVPITVITTVGRETLPGLGAYLQATVPYPSLATAYDNTGITNDSDPAPGNFDGAGNSYAAQALAAVGITPGGAVTSGGITFTWPDVPADQPDNVAADGQTIPMSGAGSTLGFLGAAQDGTQTGTGTIYYTDGTAQSFTIGFANWIDTTPVDGDTLVATTSYENRTTSGHVYAPSLFAAFVPLESGKTVAAVTLPSNTDMHIFATGTG
jgi:beta-glucosidase